jgi:uncharacterized protein HemX
MTEIVSAMKDFLAIIQAMGPLGIIFFLWWDGAKERKKVEEKSREENKKWEERFQAMKRMYENNVELVKAYESIAKDLHDTVVYNTTVMTQVKDIADHNLYCPLVRKKSKQSEVDA